MASRFVSGGTIDTSNGEAVADAEAGKSSLAAAEKRSPMGGSQSRNQGEWEAVQRELDADRRRREEARRAEAVGGERSLFEVLQANKAAKQAAFEEATAIKNQFRPLDDDEVDFLDSVQAEERKREAALRRETEEGVGKFREEQARVEAVDGEAVGEEGAEGWVVGGAARKRKRKEDRGGIRGVKRRGSSGVGEGSEGEKKARSGQDIEKKGVAETVMKPTSIATAAPVQAAAATPAPAKGKLGLVDYGSDDDDDDD